MFFRRAAAPVRPDAPVHYQEWLELFALAEQNPADHTLFERMRRGTAPAGLSVQNSYYSKLMKTAAGCLQKRTHRFLTDFQTALDERDWDEAERQAARFCREGEECFFFRDVKELPDDVKMQTEALCARLMNSIWPQLIRQLRLDGEEYRVRELDELAWLLSRQRVPWQEKGIDRQHE